jgi:hypothetical protein
MVTVVARALIHGGGPVTTMQSALVGLFLFAAVGWIVGLLAEHAIREAIRQRLAAELRALAAEAEPHEDRI